MKKILFFYSVYFLATTLGISQNMKKGFNLLETGKFNQAETFFENILKEYPTNKTAKICFGRAVGLNGDAKKAKTIFLELLKIYPNSFEVKLNYGESLLWNKEFEQAENYYLSLIKTNDTDFAALLGYANTLANLKKYNQALTYVDKALLVSNNSPNALISKKYILLGLANQKLQNHQYEKAIEILHNNLKLFPNDKDIYVNLANTYVVAKQFENAKATYIKISKLNDLYFTAQNGLSLVAHLQQNDKEALTISKQLIGKLNSKSKPNDITATHQRYVQALIWNKKLKQASNHIQLLSKKYHKQNWLMGLKATLYTYTGDFDNTIKTYNEILKNDSKSFDGNLGKANALKANNQTKEAYELATKSLTYFPKQQDITNFIGQIKTSLIPSYETKNSYSYDNGESKAFTSHHNINLPINTKTKLLGRYTYKKADNNITDNNSTSNLFGLGVSYQLYPKVNISAILGVDNVNGNKNSYQQLITDVVIKTKPAKRQTLDIGYKRELQNFNAELLNRNIVQNNFYGNYNLNTTFNLGWFTQYFFTQQNDSNQRNLLFTSVYYNILSKPILKAGLNYQYMSFKNQVPTIYFSPKKFNAVELFTNLIKDKNATKDRHLYYGLTAAIGYQYIEQEAKKTTYRVETNLGYRFNSKCFLEGYFLRSNIASAATEVFTFTEVGIKFKWLFLKKPIFKL
ncbi:tetratricopeptide repeat protein [Wenyingzhuangia sp. IMCC45533]